MRTSQPLQPSRETLVLENLRRCQAIAGYVWRRIGRRIPFDDLYQYGCIGLIKAAARYEASLGARFLTYADHKIRGEILDGIRKERGQGKKQTPALLSLSLPVDGLPTVVDFRTTVETRLDFAKVTANYSKRQLTRMLSCGHPLKPRRAEPRLQTGLKRGRPFTDNPRCACGAMTLKCAKARCHKCSIARAA